MPSENSEMTLCLTIFANSDGNLCTTLVGSITVLFAFINIASNALLIFAMYKSKQIRTHSNKFLLIMTISDLCTGIFVMPGLGIFWIAGKQRSCLEVQIMEFLMMFFAYMSILMIVCISVDRYFHVTKQVRYQAWMNRFRFSLIVAAFLGVGFVMAMLSISLSSFYLVVAMVIFKLLQVLCLIIFNTRTLRILERHQRTTVLRLQNGSQIANGMQIVPNEKLRAIRTIRLVLAAVLACYLPVNIATIAWTYFKFNLHIKPGFTLTVLYEWTKPIMFSVTFLNSLIIFQGNKKIRRTLSSIFRKDRVDHE
ncbi:5-hydroxytryptamine receptor 2A-like [Rhopilema esculentum]|uniref:5-hydroxytryptamine receptor 2A-like n=1 Tax=Rhopilema esculentum TaxID=499914 RepID=UPI0031E3511B